MIDRSRLTVRREGERHGIWPFRRAAYSVYADSANGQRLVIVRGDFSDYHQAIKAAMSILDWPLDGARKAS